MYLDKIMGKAKAKSYTIYKMTNGSDTYVGMTTQTLANRFNQHKRDAGAETCSITNKLCKKKLPTDLKALYRRLRDHPAKFSISKLKEVTASYSVAHKEELKLKSQHSTL